MQINIAEEELDQTGEVTKREQVKIHIGAAAEEMEQNRDKEKANDKAESKFDKEKEGSNEQNNNGSTREQLENSKKRKYDNISKEMQEYYVGTPHSWEYVEGSKGWFIIETTKNYKFYFNKKTNEKTWECPEDVEELFVRQKMKKEDINNVDKQYEDAEKNDYNKCVGRDNSFYGNDGSYGYDTKYNDSADPSVNQNRNRKDEDLEFILREYKNLLIEKNINEFCKYENVLAYMLYDRRYLNVPKERRKEFFHILIKEIKEEKKCEIKTLVENFINMLNEMENKFTYPFSEYDAVHILKGKKEYKGNYTKEWANSRNKLLGNFLEKKKKEKQKQMEEEFEQILYDHMQDENPGVWIKIKNNLMKNEKYVILSYDKKNKIFEDVSQTLLAKRKQQNRRSGGDRRSGRADTDDGIHFRKGSQTLEEHKKNTNNEKNIFLSLLHEKLKHPNIDEGLLNDHKINIKKNSNFENDCFIPRELTNDERYKKLKLNASEKYYIYKEFIKNYINLKREMFDKLLGELSINCINNSLEDIIKMTDKNNKSFKSLKRHHLEEVHAKWRNYKIREAKKIFKDFLKKSNFVKHDSDEREKYADLVNELSTDVSYQRLDCVPEEREEIIKERIKELKVEHEQNKNLAERLNF
ncbi:hypothetical protein MKS88_002711 [Plasmodium brasilianum]|uniref:WW domain-containing protein n=2 Tax=Plasmodium (Plasmodium) TaxID=418103 RepID=A0A1D3PBG7_PLAMA|nr:conserved Plasmodium protein, unknown function [Plasmodium malariae]KAI4838237.1 hypothetical protein MKS88_002711 [Plasmodium brasilianum]SCN12634.1 conserved Plasmodium protein, unknown function [Plasmodium malariae]